MIGGAIAVAVALTSAFIAIAAIWLRLRAYRRRVSYDPTQHCVLGLDGVSTESVSLQYDSNGIVLPADAAGAVSALLELDVQASFSGCLFDPAIEINAGDFHDEQYFERGVQGRRFLNVSRLLKDSERRGQISLSGHDIASSLRSARLHVCHEGIAADDRVLVIAPHPDDAEIAAFGLYSDTCATVVTLTAGDASDRYRNPAQPWMSLSRSEVAHMRVLDSLAIPQLGHVSPERAINLCFPDGRLRSMHRDPDASFQDKGDGAVDFVALRRMNRTTALQFDDWACNWKSLVNDLSRLIKAAAPTIVVTPHPKLDPHPDHRYATVAVAEALQMAGWAVKRMFLYVVHNRRSELWPFGPAGSGMAYLPILPGDGICGSGFYSHPLSVERQRQKLVALEAMHDVRDQQWPSSTAYGPMGARIAGELRALVHGMGRDPTSYLRRAVRPDELFLVASWQQTLAMARGVIEPSGLH